VVREGVEDDDAEGVDVAGIAAEGREDADVKVEGIPGIAEVEAGSIVRVDDDSCFDHVTSGPATVCYLLRLTNVVVATRADVGLVSVVAIPDLAEVDVGVEDRLSSLLSLLLSLFSLLPSSCLSRLRRAASSTCNKSIKDIPMMSSWSED